MLPNFLQPVLARRLRGVACATLAIALTACGGGGGSPGTTSGNTGTTGTGTGSKSTITTDPTLAVKFVDAAGTDITSLSGGQTGVVRATLKDAAGLPAAGGIVTVTAATDLLDFPQGSSARTDATGLAVINIRPKSNSASGAVKVAAAGEIMSGVSVGKGASATFVLSIGAAPLTVDSIAFNPVPSSALPAFSTAALSIKVSSGGAPATEVTGLTLSSTCGSLASLVQGTLKDGVLSATYTNNGCLIGTDTVTAAIGNSSKSTTLPVSAANIGTIQFVGSDLQGSSIVLKGSGGLGRKESALLTYRVLDQNNKGLAGVDVSFRATTTTGGLLVAPTKGTTDASGNVTTTVSSGTIPTPVRVIAEATRNGINIVGLSDTLIISTGLPIQKAMSLSSDSYNFEAWNRDGEEVSLTVRLADQYGNKIADDTAVNFVTEGGAIATSSQGGCVTRDGACTVKLVGQNFRPANGRVTVMAYVQGIENFVDSNGDGQYSCTNFTDPQGNPTTLYRPLIDICVSGGEPFTDQGDPFLDTGSLGPTSGVSAAGTLDGVYDPANGDLPIPYNHAQYSAAGNGKWGINYISASAEIIFSGQDPTLIRQVCTNAGCRDWTAADGNASLIAGLHGTGCATQEINFRLIDVNNNPLAKGTALTTVDSDKLTPLSISPPAVGSTNTVGGTSHTLRIKPDAACAPGSFGLSVVAPVSKTAKTYYFNSAP